MKHLIGKNILVTTQNFFIGHDGVEYRAAWGPLKAIHTSQETLSFTPSRANTNWFIELGSMVIAGCQVLYLIQCDDEPNTSRVQGWTSGANEDGIREFLRPTLIYLAK